MVQAILGTLMLNEDADEYWAKFLAFNIDRELNALFPDQKLYISKARSIAANLRNNQVMNVLESVQYIIYHNFLSDITRTSIQWRM